MQNRVLTDRRRADELRNDALAEPQPTSRELLALAFEGDFSWAFKLEDMLDRIEGRI